MVTNKISEQLLKIINNEITEIEFQKPNFTEDNLLNVSIKETEAHTEKSMDSIISLPVIIDGYIPVIILFRNFSDMNSENIKNILAEDKIKYEYTLIPGIAASLTIKQIIELSMLSEVEIISFDGYVTATLDTARKWFGVNKAVETFHLTGNKDKPKTFTKEDSVIAILDTGIDINHVDLGSGKVIGWHDEINPASTTPYDDNGHGTHVASIAAGLGKAIWDYRGVALGAALVGVKVLNAAGFGSYSQIIAGIQWCVANKSNYGIRIINMSLGGPSDVALRAATTAAVNNGIVVLCAAGNSGPGLGTIGSPGDTPAAITVGNMSDVGQGGFFLIPSSSRGPIFDGSIKPDLCGPGYIITAAKAGTTNQYTAKTGTSMSTPFVAGVVALMLDANSSLTPSQIKRILTETAELWGDTKPNNDYGYGKLMAFEALARVCRLRGSKCFKPPCSCDNKCCVPKANKPPQNNPLPPMCPLYPNHFSISNTISTPNSSDWYEFYVTRLGFPVAITLLTLSPVPPNDVDIYVFDSNYNTVASAVSSTRQDTVYFFPTHYGKYLIRVSRFAGTSVRYQLDLSVFGNNFRLFESTI